MNKKELLSLYQISKLNPKEIKKKKPDLFKSLSGKVERSLKCAAVSKLKHASKLLRNEIKNIDANKIGRDDIKTVLEKSIKAKRLPEKEKKAVEKELSKIPSLGKVDDLLQLDLPVVINPVFQPDLMKAKVYKLSDIAGLSEDKTEKAMAKKLTPASISEEKLTDLVNENILTKDEAKKLGVVGNLYEFFDNEFDLVEQVFKGKIKKAKQVDSLVDFVGLDEGDWEEFIKDTKFKPKDGLKPAEYATVLTRKVESLFPSQSLVHRSLNSDAKSISKNLTELKPVFELNEGEIFGVDGFESLILDGINKTDAKRYKKYYEEVTTVTGRLPGIKLDETLNDNSLSAAEKGKKVVEQSEVLRKFTRNNQNIEFLSLNYMHDSDDIKSLDFKGLNKTEQKQVVNTVKGFQRIYSFTSDVVHTESIMAAGFNSAFHITAITLNDFIEKTKLPAEIATRYYENAHQSMIKTTGVIGTVFDILTGSFDWTNVGNTGVSVLDYLKDIPGYQDLFGDLAFCDCEHCQSIYSPSAYFVDLMQFIEKYITSVHFTGSKENNFLNLKTRRPDLWVLPLTCENTDTLVPYLDVINEILESYIASEKGFTGSLSDRDEVETFVYKNEIALENIGNWKNKVHSFLQPFNFPIESLTTYLSHFEKTRYEAGQLLGLSQDNLTKLKLNLSDKEYTLITVANNNKDFLKRVYGINFAETTGKIDPIDSQVLLKAMSLSREELGLVLGSSAVTKNGTEKAAFKSEKRDRVKSIQNDIENVHGLTFDILDRAHRFVRLWNKSGWLIGEVDLVVRQMNALGTSTGIDDVTVNIIAHIIFLNEKLELKVEEVCTLWGRISDLAVTDENPSLLKKLFNHEGIVITEGEYPKNTTDFIHPALVIDNSTTPAEFSSSRLLAGLNRSDDELLSLITHLALPLGIIDITSTVDESKHGFKLTLKNLTLLYRHSRLAAVLELSILDLFQSIKLIDGISNDYLDKLDDTEKLLEFINWQKKSEFTIDDLHFITGSGDVIDSSQFSNADDIIFSVREQVSSENSLKFSDTVLAYLDGINEEQSREIISENSAIIELSDDGENYWLKSGFDPATAITVPAGITTAEEDLRNELKKYHPIVLVPHYLSNQLKFTYENLSEIIKQVGINLTDSAFLLELRDSTIPAEKLIELVEKLLPYDVVLRDSIYASNIIQYVFSEPTYFEIDPSKNISVNTVKLLTQFTGFIDPENDSSFTDLSTVMSTFDNAVYYLNSDQEKIASILQAESASLATIHPVVASHANPVSSLVNYKDIVDYCSVMGIGGSILPLMVSNAYDDSSLASASILASFRSKYADEQERNEKLEPYQDTLRSKKRAALTNYLISSGFPQFEDDSDLFSYFLVDTELEGCARTSRLVAATMSLQLYIHRVLLNLEEGGSGSNKIHVLPTDIPEDEWSWRKNYRVWEANRKVFLYPENYIEPELRDNKTSLFDELESNLLQQEINEDTVLEAYAKYMRGFDEVAHLKIAGSFHEKDEETQTDVLHMFGVTADEPPMYYYRAVENIYYSEKQDNRGTVWGNWQKINVQIPVRKVAPIIFNGRLHVFWVRVTSLAKTVFDENRSIFTGYDHKYSIEFTTLKVDGTWTVAQKLNLKDEYPFTGNGVIQDPLADPDEINELRDGLHDFLRSFPFFDPSTLNAAIRKLKTPRYDTKVHNEPVDEYSLDGFLWDQVYPFVEDNKLILSGAGYQMCSAIDFYNLSIQQAGTNLSGGRETIKIISDKPGKIFTSKSNSLYRGVSPQMQLFDNYAFGSLLVNTTRSNELLKRHWYECTIDACFDDVQQEKIATFSSGTFISIVNGAFSDAIVDSQGDILLLQGSPVEGNGFLLKRIGTTLSETLTRTLFTSGIDTMLDIKTQKKLKEADIPITIVNNRIVNKVVKDKIDFTGPYGTYYREIFFHIPFLLANYLNSQGKYEEAQKWYHYIFDPSSTEVIDSSGSGLTQEEKDKRERDRSWQYLEFREIDTDSLREQLQDKQAIEEYKKDPFNPHAISRLRLSAYQKSIVMKYIDNLLDWGDHLFSQDTMESINEATLLYVLAKEILGDRPAQIGGCGEGKVIPRTYENIAPMLDQGSEFLAEIENYTFTRAAYPVQSTFSYAYEARAIQYSAAKAAKKVNSTFARTYMPAWAKGIDIDDKQEIKKLEGKYIPEITIKPVAKETAQFSHGITRTFGWKKDSIYVKDRFKLPSFGRSIVSHITPVFCVPGNKDLLKYWDRVDDRLYKIRNCMNIDGQVRQLALFAPEIDPALLVRATAAGLSLDDVLNSLSGNLPPYRFSYIVEKAKAYTSVVQSFGSSLLSALEKKDSEELGKLRILHQQNILEMATNSRKLEIDSANEAIKIINDRIESINYKIGYYDLLIAERINLWEGLQSGSRHIASGIRVGEATLGFLAGVLNLLPQLGSPFAMKYGGVELGESGGKLQTATGTLAAIADNTAASAGLEAGFERRKKGWEHQKKLIESELKQTEKSLIAAEIKRDILIESDKIHQKNIEQNSEMMELYGKKFSNLGLYTWLSSTMQRLFKDAYNNAMAIAKLAEQAYQFERDDNTFYINDNYFESPRAGLLAGERLLLGLQSMEKRYIETNYRKNEIDQSFSLTQLDSSALLLLKETGSCEFDIPEIFFDLFYPGQYKRKIQAVRLTIPSVTGPYTNVSANLSLVKSDIRMEAKLGNVELKEVPKSRTTNIATSTAQNDAGVFQLNFKDERYMPFEGAGAISRWKLSLPKSFRQFDYNTINDVIVHISYTAEYDELFRDKVEDNNAAIEGTLANILKNNTLTRTFSFRQEFSTEFNRLIHQPVNNPVLLKFEDKHFPLFVSGKTIKVASAKIILVTADGQSVNAVDISIDGSSFTGFAADAALAGLNAKDLGSLFNAAILKEFPVEISDAGDLAPDALSPGDISSIDQNKLEDIIFLIDYKVE